MGSNNEEPRQRLRVLLVDDSSENRTLFTRYLKGVDVDIHEISTGYGALEACRRHEYDYIFLDMLMPGLDGIKVMSNIQQMKLPNKPKIYAFTAAASVQELETYNARGFDGMVPKPFTRETLRMALKLNDRTPVAS